MAPKAREMGAFVGDFGETSIGGTVTILFELIFDAGVQTQRTAAQSATLPFGALPSSSRSPPFTDIQTETPPAPRRA